MVTNCSQKSVDALHLVECGAPGLEGDRTNPQVVLPERGVSPSEEDGTIEAGSAQKDAIAFLQMVSPLLQ